MQYTRRDRLGLTALICQDCNVRNDPDANRCRKCGNRQLRRRNEIDRYD